MPGRIERRGPFLLTYAIDQQVRQIMELTFNSAPLTPGEFAMYSVLNLVERTTPSELAADLGLSRSTLSNALRRMDSRGHLRRKRNPDDGRSQLVSLTAAARRLTVQCLPAFEHAITAFGDHHLDHDEERLLEAMEAMSAACEKAIAQA